MRMTIERRRGRFSPRTPGLCVSEVSHKDGLRWVAAGCVLQEEATRCPAAETSRHPKNSSFCEETFVHLLIITAVGIAGRRSAKEGKSEANVIYDIKKHPNSLKC